MTVREALVLGRNALKDHETDTPDLDAALLLCHAMGITREKLYMMLGDDVAPEVRTVFDSAMARRTGGEPVAWITGHREFWGLDFVVGPGVLTPRPDSEVLIEEALVLMDAMTSAGTAGASFHLHDCCTGPGTLALALKSERPDWEISASDISDVAGRYFEINNSNLCRGEAVYTGADLMEGVDGPFDIIVSNPPYLTPGETSERVDAGWKEPVLALDGGGSDGLEVIRRLIPAMDARLKPGGAVLIEADPLQMPIIGEILGNTGFTGIRIRKDLGDRDRLIIAFRGDGL